MLSQRIVAGGLLAVSCSLLGGCGSGSTTTPPAPGPPGPWPPADIDYDEKTLVDTFGNDPNFLWGAATAAAQIEGAWNVSGKQASIWDDFCHSIRAMTGDTTANPFHKQCGNFPEGADQNAWTTLEVTDDFYHRYNEDLDLLQSYGMNAMRISLSWPRLMPYDNNTRQHVLSTEGRDFYLSVLNKMHANGITPVVTLFHWDLPNDLSFLRDDVVDEFGKYADTVFREFGGLVQHWATFNEPTSTCSLGYSIGAFAPGHKSTTDHLICGKNLLLAHATAVQKFRDARLAGSIGIVLDYKWTYPADQTNADDIQMAQWDWDNVIGFWADPIFGSGDFPQSLKDFFGDKMPVLSPANISALKGSADFWGANTYGGKLTNKDAFTKTLSDYEGGNDMAERYSFCPCNDGEERHPWVLDEDYECAAASGWLWARSDAMYQYLNHIKTNYSATLPIYVTEFGCDVDGEGGMNVTTAYSDIFRKTYYQKYMMQIARAKNEGANIKGVFAWSLMDNFEWGDGLDFRFGITYVDFNSPNLTRTPKMSAEWWQGLIANMSSSSVLTV